MMTYNPAVMVPLAGGEPLSGLMDSKARPGSKYIFRVKRLRVDRLDPGAEFEIGTGECQGATVRMTANAIARAVPKRG